MSALRAIGRWIRRAIELAVIFCLAGSLVIAGIAIASDFITVPGWTTAALH